MAPCDKTLPRTTPPPPLATTHRYKKKHPLIFFLPFLTLPREYHRSPPSPQLTILHPTPTLFKPNEAVAGPRDQEP